jgi:RNA polymerase-binding protein DksA
MTYDELRELLQRKKAELTEQLMNMKREVNDQAVGYSNHMADAGTEVFEQARNVSLIEPLRRSLEDVQRALDKFEDGTYGICESCGAIIDIPRLEVKPEARYCIKCATRIEENR